MPRTKPPPTKSERLARQVKRRRRKRKQQEQQPEKDPGKGNLISTGSTLLNLACSDSPWGGFGLGKMVNVIGDRSSGKTLLALTIFAEMAQKKDFDPFRFIYDEPESSLEFNISKLFGSSVERRIEAPAYDKDGEPLCSDSIQDFQINVMKALRGERPFIYVLDSFDALTSDEEKGIAKATVDGTKAKGSYGVEKAKVVGRILRLIIKDLKRTQSVLIIISQTRDNLNALSFKKKTRSGGKALEFYACHELWLAVAKKHKKRDRTIGIDVVVRLEKNKLTGKYYTITFPIYYSYGIDDIGSCIDFMVEEGYWETAGKKGTKIDAKDLQLETTKGKLIESIEEKRLERKLKRAVATAWNDIEESLQLGRKKKYR